MTRSTPAARSRPARLRHVDRGVDRVGDEVQREHDLRALPGGLVAAAAAGEREGGGHGEDDEGRTAGAHALTPSSHGAYAAAVSSDLVAEVRRHCAEVAAAARWVSIDLDAPIAPGGLAGLDPVLHLLEAPPEERARYVLVLDAINFGSGWFPTLRAEAGESLTNALTRRLTEHARERGGPWTAAELRALERARGGAGARPGSGA